jgi:hypothetical protein
MLLAVSAAGSSAPGGIEVQLQASPAAVVLTGKGLPAATVRSL